MSTMPKFSNRQTIFIAVGAVVILFVIMQFAIMPRIQSWMNNKYPEVKALQKEFPDRGVNVKDTRLVSDGEKQRILTISSSGADYLDEAQVNRAKAVICNSLGKDATHYAGIMLQNTKQRNVLGFYLRESKSESITCK